ncbi:MAG: putative membrane protein [halophilic archaeon J07HB67]|nr:MAG: putative membrane protein [halophilic archaeon J07HB67]
MARPPHDGHGTHALIEHYTPDGTLGRLLFGSLVGGGASALTWVGAAGLATGQRLGFLVGVPSAVFGLALFAVTLAAVWPVYLSVIGNLDGPATYAVGEGLETPEADPKAVLQRRYADGEITREAFERRMDDLLAVDAGRRPSEGDRPVDESGVTPEDDAPGDRVTAADAPETDELRTARERARRRREGDDTESTDRGEREPSREG